MRRKKQRGGRSNEEGEEGATRRLEKKMKIEKVASGRIVDRSVLFSHGKATLNVTQSVGWSPCCFICLSIGSSVCPSDNNQQYN